MPVTSLSETPALDGLCDCGRPYGQKYKNYILPYPADQVGCGMSCFQCFFACRHSAVCFRGRPLSFGFSASLEKMLPKDGVESSGASLWADFAVGPLQVTAGPHRSSAGPHRSNAGHWRCSQVQCRSSQVQCRYSAGPYRCSAGPYRCSAGPHRRSAGPHRCSAGPHTGPRTDPKEVP